MIGLSSIGSVTLKDNKLRLKKKKVIPEVDHEALKYGLQPCGNLKCSNPARRVDVASILISLSKVSEKYAGYASATLVQFLGIPYNKITTYHPYHSSCTSRALPASVRMLTVLAALSGLRALWGFFIW